MKNNNEEMNIITYNLLIKFLKGNDTLEKFCFLNSINKGYFKDCLIIAKNIYPAISFECVNHIEKTEKEKEININSDIYSIINLIKNSDIENPINVIDYFLNTKYGFNEITKVADNILDVTDNKAFRQFVSPLKKMKVLKDTSHLLNDKLIIQVNGNMKEVTKEKKLAIINTLEELNIPLTIETFKEACYSYYNNENINTKHL